MMGRRFIAGLFAHAGDIAAITNQHVNPKQAPVGGGGPVLCVSHLTVLPSCACAAYKPKKSVSA